MRSRCWVLLLVTLIGVLATASAPSHADTARLLAHVDYQGQDMGLYFFECPPDGCSLTVSEAISALSGVDQGSAIPPHVGISLEGQDSAAICNLLFQRLGFSKACSEITNDDLANILPNCTGCTGSNGPFSISYMANVDGGASDAYNHASETNCIVPTESANLPIDEFDAFLAPIQSPEIPVLMLLSQTALLGRPMGLYFFDCPSGGCTMTVSEAIGLLWGIEQGTSIPPHIGISLEGSDSTDLCEALLQSVAVSTTCSQITIDDLTEILPACVSCAGSNDVVPFSYLANVDGGASDAYNHGVETNCIVSAQEGSLPVEESNAFLAPIRPYNPPLGLPVASPSLLSLLTLAMIGSGGILLTKKGRGGRDS